MVCTYVLGKAGSRKDLAKDAAFSERMVKQTLENLNTLLLSKTYLVEDQITVADISMCLSLFPVKIMLKDTFRSGYVNVNRWMNTLLNQDEFKSVLGNNE